jgi:ribosomal protein S18 acetylase RimI-like enzyme
MVVSHLAVRVRDIRPHEYDEVAALSVEAWREFAPALTAEDWATIETSLLNVEKRAGQGSMIVAEQGGKLAGAVGYFAPGTPRHERFPGEWALVIMLAVRPSHRGRGIGKLLTEECIQRARRDGARRIGLHTGEVMAAARALYENLGFKPQREFRQYGLRYRIYVLDLPTDG